MRSKPGARPRLRRRAGKRPRKKTTQRSQPQGPGAGTDPPRLVQKPEAHQIERERADEALRASEEQFRSLFEHMFSAFILVEVLLDRDGNPVDHRLLQANPAFERMTGLKRSEELGRTSSELSFQWPPEVAQAYYRVALGGQPLHLERFNESLQRYYDIRAFSPRRGQVALLFLDITESRQAEAALRHSETKYRRLHQSMREAHASVGMDGQLQEFNQVFVELLGYTEEELRSMTFRDLTPAQWHAMEADILRTQVLSRGYSDIYEKEYRRKDGTTFPVELRTFLVRDDTGQPATMWAIIRNITVRKQTEAALRESELFTRSVLNSLTAHIAVLDAQGTIVAVNEAWRQFARLNACVDQTAYVGANYLSVCEESLKRGADETAAVALRGLRAVMNGAQEEFSLEYPCHSPEEQRWFSLRATRFPGEGLVRLVVAHENITERKCAEAELHDLSGKLLRSQDEERRRIARELHDTTVQGLTAVLINLSLVDESNPGLNDKTRQLLADAVALGEQCARELRTVSYLLHPPMLDELGLAGAMRDYADGFARRSGLRVDLELPRALKGVPRETGLALFRVMQEALANVRRHSGSRTASIRLACTATELRLEVRDQGRGMKAAGKLSAGHSPGGGPGVGIPGMSERMRQLGGALEIESDDHGTRVIAIAPVTGQTPAQSQA
jgi:two-component system, NarL family, sensor kinase